MKTFFRRLVESRTAQPAGPVLVSGMSADPATAMFATDLMRSAFEFSRIIGEFAPRSSIVPLYLGKNGDCVAAMLGTLLAGKTFACLNRKLRAYQLAAILRQADSSILVVDGAGLLALANAIGSEPDMKRWHLLVLKSTDFTSMHENLVERLRTMLRLDLIDITGPRSETPSIDGVSFNQHACCLFTSGSTGTPKGVLIGADDLIARAEAEADWYGLGADDVLLSILPFSFDVGLNQLFSGLISGARIVLSESWLPADIVGIAGRCGVTGISGVPTIWRSIINAGLKFDTAETHRPLRYITVSGGDLTADELRRLPAMAPGAGIIKTYGQTETFRSSCLRPHEYETKHRSIGRPFEGVRLAVVDDNGQACAANEVGEIVHAGLGVMSGYLSADTNSTKIRTDLSVSPIDKGEPAVLTGDYGYLDDDGYLHLVGRRDTMLKISGNRIYPAEVVEQINRISGVRTSDVIAETAADGESKLVAFVVAGSDGEPTDLAIKRELAKRLPAYMVPQVVILLAEMPLTESGKHDRPELARRARQVLRDETAPAPLRSSA